MFDRALPPELREAAIRVARSEGIPDSWLNNEVARLGEDGTGFGLDQTPLFSGRRLFVYAFDMYALIALKLVARRDKDEDDIFRLMEATHHTTPSSLAELVADYFGPQGYAWAEDLVDGYHTRSWL